MKTRSRKRVERFVAAWQKYTDANRRANELHVELEAERRSMSSDELRAAFKIIADDIRAGR